MNTIHEMTLDLFCKDQEQASRIESELNDFAHNDLAEAIDEALTSATPKDENIVIENLTVDLENVPSNNPLSHIRQALPQAFANQIKIQLVAKKTIPVEKILLLSCCKHLHPEKASVIEKEIHRCLAAWCNKHFNERFEPLKAAESVLSQLEVEFPELDIKQIACSTFEKMSNLGKAPDTQQTHLLRAGDCGVILLFPFIPMLFDKTGCTSGGKFSNDNQKALALSVLSYTVYGHYTVPPADVSIIQLLCGFDAGIVPTEMPLLSDDQKEIAESLLNEVIHNWGAIGNTSPDGLRTSFLVRKGTLSENNNRHNLKIRPSSFDILLDKVPWSYSVLKFPWMKKPLFVTWR